MTKTTHCVLWTEHNIWNGQKKDTFNHQYSGDTHIHKIGFFGQAGKVGKTQDTLSVFSASGIFILQVYWHKQYLKDETNSKFFCFSEPVFV